MIAFRATPGVKGGLRRPLLDVYLDPGLIVPQTCLVDTGAAAIRLEIERRLAVRVDQAVLAWTARVSFCDPWPHPFGLLGHAGFLDAFDVLIQGREERFELTART